MVEGAAAPGFEGLTVVITFSHRKQRYQLLMFIARMTIKQAISFNHFSFDDFRECAACMNVFVIKTDLTSQTQLNLLLIFFHLLLCLTVIISTTAPPAFDYVQKLMMDYEIRCVIDPLWARRPRSSRLGAQSRRFWLTASFLDCSSHSESCS